MANIDDIKKLFQALDFERTLDLDHPADRLLYVAGMHEDGGISAVDELKANIELSARPGTWLFTGHRGVGKSTELRRMAHELRQGDFYVVVADMEKRLNLGEPVKLESLLVSLAAALADEADRDFGASRATGTYGQRLWEWLTQTEVNLTQLGANLGGASFTAQMQTNPSFRAEVQRALESSRGGWFEQVKGFIKSVVDDIRQARGQGTQVVLVLDSLERLRVSGPNAKDSYEAIIQVFDVNGQFLKLDHVHTVYSVPPFLPFLVPRIGGYFGVEVCKLPHVKVFETPDLNKGAQPVHPHAAGINGLVSSARKRYPDIESIIPLAQLRRLALASSGSVRDYFRLLKSVCAKAAVQRPSLPLQDDTLAATAERVLRDEMPLSVEDLQHLALVRTKHGVALDSMDNLHKVARLFDGGLILSYRNGIGDWCEVQYLLHEQVAPYLPAAEAPSEQ
ncbi:MAG TPA: hypothetical protein VGM81_19065 [Burkholderiaceae bacterium]|jgi:hypothetical protein